LLLGKENNRGELIEKKRDSEEEGKIGREDKCSVLK